MYLHVILVGPNTIIEQRLLTERDGSIMPVCSLCVTPLVTYCSYAFIQCSVFKIYNLNVVTCHIRLKRFADTHTQGRVGGIGSMVDLQGLRTGILPVRE